MSRARSHQVRGARTCRGGFQVEIRSSRLTLALPLAADCFNVVRAGRAPLSAAGGRQQRCGGGAGAARNSPRQRCVLRVLWQPWASPASPLAPNPSKPGPCPPLLPPGPVFGGLAKHAVVDIDANNAGNPLACSEYAADIFDHLHDVEVRADASPVRSLLLLRAASPPRSGTRMPPLSPLLHGPALTPPAPTPPCPPPPSASAAPTPSTWRPSRPT